MLNDAGRVAEATGACVLMVQRGRIVTPPTSESCLDSITVDILEEVAKELGMPFDRRPIERTELLAADECGLAGTISELTLVSELDGVEYDQTGLLAQLRQRYLELMRGDLVLPGVELAPLADVSRQLLPAEAGV
jgi:branched-chain amino acid aminotransferase